MKDPVNLKKIVLIASGSILILLIIFLGLNFYFSRDTVIKMVPSDFLFYGHLNLNSLTWSGRENQQWLSRFSIDQYSQDLDNQQIFHFFREVIQPERLSQIKELGIIVFYQSENGQLETAVIGRTRKPIQISQFFPDKESIRLLGPKTFIFTSQPNLSNKFFLRNNLKQNPQYFFSFNFFDGFINLNKMIEIFKSNQISKFVWEPFLAEQKDLPDFLRIKIRAKEENLFFKIGPPSTQRISIIKDKKMVDPSASSESTLGYVEGVDDFSELFKFIPPDTNLFFRNFNLSDELFFRFFLPAKFNLAKPNAFIFQPPAYLLIYPGNQSIEEVENQIREKIALYFPQEVKRVLPDQTEVVELVADPSLINFNQEEINRFLVRYWQKEDFEVDLASNEKFIFLSNNLSLLKKSLNSGQTNIARFLGEECFIQGEETMFWQPFDQGFWLVVNQISDLNFQGCLIESL